MLLGVHRVAAAAPRGRDENGSLDGSFDLDEGSDVLCLRELGRNVVYAEGWGYYGVDSR